jgi:hypothetical protein
MNIKWFLLVFLILVLSLTLHPAAVGQFFKLEKTAVSGIPNDLLIPGLDSIVVDQTGNVFAFAGKDNGNECFIVKFDKNLNYLKHFGSNGKGPGEFTTKVSSTGNRLSLDQEGYIYIVDFNPLKLVVYDNNGRYKRDIPIAKDYARVVGNLYQMEAIGNGTFIGIKFNWNLPPQARIFTLEPPQVKVKYNFEAKAIRVENIDYEEKYYGQICLIGTDTKHVVIGESQVYKFQLYDRSGNLKLEVFDKNRVMKAFNDKEFEFIRNSYKPNANYSSVKNDFYRQLNNNPSKLKKILNIIKNSKNVIADIKLSGNRIYVFPVRDDITIKDKFPLEIYNLKGQLVKKGYFKKVPNKIWKNHIYFNDRDAEDNPCIIKYTIQDND